MTAEAASSATTTRDRASVRPSLSVLIVNYNTWWHAADAVRSLLRHPPSMPFEVVVVDNASPQRDPAAERALEDALAELGPHGQLIRSPENGGYSKGMNLALSKTDPGSEWILVSNPDVIYREGSVDALVDALRRDETAGVTTPVIRWDPDGQAKLPPNILPTLPDLLRQIWASVSTAGMRHYMNTRLRDAIRLWRPQGDVAMTMMSGCCFVIRRSLVDEMGFFDERFPLYFEDTDFSRRILKRGLRIVQVADATIVHLYDRSSRTDHSEAMRRYWISREAYYRKWEGPLGIWLYRLLRRIQESKLGKRLAGRDPHRMPTTVIPPTPGAPVVELPYACDDFLVEICPDRLFALTGASFGSGKTWSPGPALLEQMPPREWWFRVIDLTKPGMPQIGVYTCTTLPPAAPPSEVAV